MLTSSLAQSVAAENAAATGLGILITDPDGTVIGSSDPTGWGPSTRRRCPAVAGA